MIVEVGHFALVLAFVLSICLSILPIWGSFRHKSLLVHFARPAAYLIFVLVLTSFMALVYAFVKDDFSVRYVAEHSNSLLPLGYKISAVWGAHEGSMLLWVLILSVWMALVALFNRALPIEAVARILGVMGIITLGFLAFTLFTSNPFERLLNYIPIDGNDLNPLLQDIGLIIHPPILYMGYVGFSVAFAFAVAALIGGELDTTWARWSRPWTTAAWLFLTLGIALGSWWAYYELGWGGWWFWDPVENASFMPWLSGTALIHSLAVCEKRNVFKAWTVFLALTTFSLSLLGTFIVRSGVITSVHSFAQDPVRGQFILAFMGIVVISVLLLFIFRVNHVRSTGHYDMLSREFFLLLNNIFLIIALVVVFSGTLYPMFMEIFGRSVSVGAPYFNLMFSIVMAPLLVLMGIGPLLYWKRYAIKKLSKPMLSALVLTVILLILMTIMMVLPNQSETTSSFNMGFWLGLLLSSWVLASITYDVIDKTRYASTFFQGLKKLKINFWAMHLAHAGIAVTLIGIVMVSYHSHEKLVALKIGDNYQLNNYSFTFDKLENVKGANYDSVKGHITVKEGSETYSLYPEKRRYFASGMVMTEAAIDAGFTRDVYISLGESLGDGAWSIRFYIKAYMRWVWLGALFMAIAGFLAIADKRYRVARLKSKVSHV